MCRLYYLFLLLIGVLSACDRHSGSLVTLQTIVGPDTSQNGSDHIMLFLHVNNPTNQVLYFNDRSDMIGRDAGYFLISKEIKRPLRLRFRNGPTGDSILRGHKGKIMLLTDIGAVQYALGSSTAKPISYERVKSFLLNGDYKLTYTSLGNPSHLDILKGVDFRALFVSNEQLPGLSVWRKAE